MGKGIEFGVISDFRLAIDELYCLVGYCVGSSGQLYCVVGHCAGSSGQLLPTVRDKLSDPSLKVKNLKTVCTKPSLAKGLNGDG